MRTKHGSQPRRIGISEAAERLGVHPETLRRWENAGRISSVRTPGNQRRYLETDIDELLAPTDESPALAPGADRKAAS